MILKPVPITDRWSMREEMVMREGWLVRWDGQHIETRSRPPLKPIKTI